MSGNTPSKMPYEERVKVVSRIKDLFVRGEEMALFGTEVEPELETVRKYLAKEIENVPGGREKLRDLYVNGVPLTYQDGDEFEEFKRACQAVMAKSGAPGVIIQIGSSCSGFSMNPKKEFRPWKSSSDADFAVFHTPSTIEAKKHVEWFNEVSKADNDQEFAAEVFGAGGGGRLSAWGVYTDVSVKNPMYEIVRKETFNRHTKLGRELKSLADAWSKRKHQKFSFKLNIVKDGYPLDKVVDERLGNTGSRICG